MCSIVGLQGKFKTDEIIRMLKSSENRGTDSSGIYAGEIINSINLKDFSTENIYPIALGHNLLSIYDSNSRISKPQPIRKDNLIMVFNGELYNFKTIKNFLNRTTNTQEINSDSQALLYLIDFYNKNNLLKATQSAIKMIDGDYAFAVYDGENLAIARDEIGVKPLFYSQTPEKSGFASSPEALKKAGFKDIKSLKPQHILYNWKDIAPAQYLYEKTFEGNVSKINKLLKLSVLKRITDLNEVGVIFSGGVDSSLLALYLKEISKNTALNIKLYTVGTENSQDLTAAIEASKSLNLNLETCIVTEQLIRDNLPKVVKAINDNNLMKIGVGMTTYLATKMIKHDNIKVAISGQGADELFGGYKKYLKNYQDGNLNWKLREEVSNMYHVNLERDDACSMLNSVELRLPFLDKKLVELVLNIPDNKKIVSSDDDLRKSILRKIAFEEGLDYNIAYRPKKAAQYGSGIDKILRKKILKDVNLKEFIASGH